MKLTTRITKKIADVPKDAWEQVFPDTIEGYDFFRVMDETNCDQFSMYYVTVYDGEELVGAAPCFSVDFALDTGMTGKTKRIIDLMKRTFPNFLSVRAFVCGVPTGKGHIGMASREEEILEALLHKMEEMAKREKASVIAFKDFSLGYNDTLKPLIAKKFFKVDSLPYAEMDLDFDNFDKYLMKLSGASRYDLRRKFKKSAATADIKMEIVDDLDEQTLKDVHSLYMQMVDSHDVGFEVLPVEFFRNISKYMPRETKYFLWRVDGKLVAFLLALVADDLMVDYYIGLDYKVAHDLHLFFVKHRDVMKWCIENNIKRYMMGNSGYEPKRRLGFDFIPLHIYAKHRNRVINPLFRTMCKFLKFENFDPDLKKIARSLREKRASNAKGVRPDRIERRPGQHSPALH
ncbi:MAG: GNAT family N-acetyltransferase, partial [Candidatus Omnitrophica bacterium]|nr:GNAT family N-acetyltransferase [Candidatus Omnitrophota bacterium]